MIRRILLSLTVTLLVGGVFLLTAPPHAEAGPAPSKHDLQTIDKNGNRISCADLPEAKAGVILGYIVPCITRTVQNATQLFSQKMIDWLKPTFYAFLTLVIVLFGVRILQGGGQVQAEGLLLLLKITLVIGMLEIIPQTFVPLVYGVMSEAQSIVGDTIGPDEANINCNIQDYKGAQTPLVWAQMDCLIGKLYGITLGTDKDKPNMLLAASMIGLMGGFFFGGTFGAILFLTLIGVLWTMLMIVIKTASAFLNGYFYASLMLIITPLFMPLILLRAGTQYFEPWWKGILASILMPVIITAYAMFAMILYDKMLFADDSLLQNIFNNDLVKRIQAVSQPLCNKEASGNTDFRAQAGGMGADALYKNNPFFSNFVMPMLTGANDQCLGITKPSIEVQNILTDKTKTGDESPKAVFTKLFYDGVKLFILSVLISTGFSNVQQIASRLVGSSSVAQLMGPLGAIEKKLAQTQALAKRSFTSGVYQPTWGDGKGGTVAGPDFIARLAEVPGRMSADMSGTQYNPQPKPETKPTPEPTAKTPADPNAKKEN